LQKMEDRILQDTSQVLSWQENRGSDVQKIQTLVVHDVRVEIDAAFKRNHGADAFAEECNTNMSKMIELQTCMSDNFNVTSIEIHKFHEESLAHNAMIEPTIINELGVVNTLPEHFNRVIRQVINTQDVLNQDTKIVLQELAKVQQALNVDFAHVLDDMHEEMKKTHTAELITTMSNSLAIEDKQLLDAKPVISSAPDATDLLVAPKDFVEPGEVAAIPAQAPPEQPEPEKEKKDALTTAVKVTKKRFRHTLSQTDASGVCDNDAQTDPVEFKEAKKREKR